MTENQSKLVTPPTRGSFVALDKPKRVVGDDSSEPRYQMLLALPKDDPFWKKAEAAVIAAAKAKWGEIPKKFKNPIKDGDEEGEYDNLKGCYFINASNTRRPGVIDKNRQPIIDAEELYSGAWYHASVRVYAWQHSTGGKGCSFSLNNVMKVKDDERFDGGTSAEEDFADLIEDGGDDDGDSLLG